MSNSSRMMMHAGEISIRAGKGHEEEKNWPAAILSYSTAVQCLLSVAVNEYSTVTEGTEFLGNSRAIDTLRRLTELESQAIESGSGEGVYALLINAHLASLLLNDEFAKPFVDYASHQNVQQSGTPFWNAYADGFRAVLCGEMFSPPELHNLRDLEIYWRVHLDLMSEISHGKNLRAVCSRLAVGFSERNNDRSLLDDGKRIEGTGNADVKWDFRIASWAALVRRRLKIDVREFDIKWPFAW